MKSPIGILTFLGTLLHKDQYVFCQRPTESQYEIVLQPVQRRKDPDPGPKQLEQYASRLSFDRAETWGLTEISTSPLLVLKNLSTSVTFF